LQQRQRFEKAVVVFREDIIHALRLHDRLLFRARTHRHELRDRFRPEDHTHDGRHHGPHRIADFRLNDLRAAILLIAEGLAVVVPRGLSAVGYQHVFREADTLHRDLAHEGAAVHDRHLAAILPRAERLDIRLVGGVFPGAAASCRLRRA
jgi:hypothetical protein